MVGKFSADFDLVNGCYDEPACCNKCNGPNEIHTHGSLLDPNHSGETSTKCGKCGHLDYWAHGHFESGQEGLDASDKYFNVTGYGLMHVERETYERYIQYRVAKSNARAAKEHRLEALTAAGRYMSSVPEAD